MEKKEEEKKEMFEVLFGLDVNSKVEDKNGLKYLSWSWAWAEIKKRYPSAIYEIERFGENDAPYLYDETLGYMVFTRVNIDGEEHEMWLPVMDGANKAMLDHEYTYEVKKKEWDNTAKRYVYTKETKTVAKASMFDVNKTIMRCLVKNLAMFGLGLYIYSGEDLPEDLSSDDEPVEEKTTKKATKKEEVKLVTPNQIAVIKKYYTGDNLKKLLESNGIKEIEQMPSDKATDLISKLLKVKEEKKVG